MEPETEKARDAITRPRKGAKGKSAGKGKRGKARGGKNEPSRLLRLARWLRRWFWRTAFAGLALLLVVVLGYRFINPPTTLYMRSEAQRLGGVRQEWVPIEEIAPVMMRSVVAAEDANFCLHWGFDMDAIRAALEEGAQRGASTLSQQVVKNVYLWHGRSWLRKAMEAGITPVVEAFWPKRRILEVYLNIAEFDEGVFGIGAAAQYYFGTTARNLTPLQAARLAAVLPAPKHRSPVNPSPWLRKRTRSILGGARLIAEDGRAACFED